MSNAADPNRKTTPWHVRLGQFFIAACAAVGIKAAQKKTVPPLAPPAAVTPSIPYPPHPAPGISPKPSPSAGPGLSKYAPRPGDVSHAVWAINNRPQPIDPLSGIVGTAPGTPAPAPRPPAVAADARAALAPEAQHRAEPPAQPETPLVITTAASVDERLFLMRALESLYERWPVGVGDPRQLREALDALRHDAVRHRQYIKERDIDDRIAALFDDLVALLDIYTGCLADSGRIEREGKARADKERVEGVSRSGVSGGVMAGQALRAGASGGEALVTWAGVALVGSLVDELGKGPARDEAKRQALEANAREFGTRFSAALATAEAAAIALADRNGWAKGEAGFDTTPESP